MSESKDYLTTTSETGSVNISEDVIAVIAASAAAEVTGVYALHSSGGRDVAHTGRKALGKGVKILIGGEGVEIELSVIAELGHAVAKVGSDVQKAVSGAVADVCGVVPKNVDVRIAGVRGH